MQKTDKKILEEIIRVDHAGERGAIKIYEGQLLALKTIKQDETLKDKIEEMKEQEKEHLEYFEKEIQKRKIKTHIFASIMGCNECSARFWFCFAWKKSYDALYCLGRGSD